MPLCCSAICASCNMHIGVSTGVNKRNVKDTFLASRHERHDVSVFGDAGATRTVAPTLHCWSAGGTISLELMRRRVVRRRRGRCQWGGTGLGRSCVLRVATCYDQVTKIRSARCRDARTTMQVPLFTRLSIVAFDQVS